MSFKFCYLSLSISDKILFCESCQSRGRQQDMGRYKWYQSQTPDNVVLWDFTSVEEHNKAFLTRAFGLVVWFSLWVREVPSLILGMPLLELPHIQRPTLFISLMLLWLWIKLSQRPWSLVIWVCLLVIKSSFVSLVKAVEDIRAWEVTNGIRARHRAMCIVRSDIGWRR